MQEFKFNVDVMKTWIETLRTGAYPQTMGSLQTSAGYCCLGVLTDVYDKNWKPKYADGWLAGFGPLGGRYYGELSESAALPFEVTNLLFDEAPETIRTHFLNRVPFKVHGFINHYDGSVEDLGIEKIDIIDLNDTLEFDFNTIADFLELYFIKDEIPKLEVTPVQAEDLSWIELTIK